MKIRYFLLVIAAHSFAGDDLPNGEKMYNRKEIKKEKIVISDAIVNFISGQLKKRNSCESNKHNTYVFRHPVARLMHEKRIINQTHTGDYEEVNEMLKEWAIVDGKKNGPVEKSQWDEQDKTKKIISYFGLGTISTVTLLLLSKLTVSKNQITPEIIQALYQAIENGSGTLLEKFLTQANIQYTLSSPKELEMLSSIAKKILL